MLDFRREPKSEERKVWVPAQYAGPRRLAFLLFLVGVMIILIWEAPRLGRLFGPSSQRTGSGMPVIDNRLAPGGGAEQARFSTTAEQPPATLPPSSDQPPLASLVPSATGPPTEPLPPYFPGIIASYLALVRDDTIFRYEERDAWFNLLDVLNRTDEKSLEAASLGFVTYAQLFRQSRQYRGRLVRVSGTVRRAEPMEAPENDCGIKRYTRLWLFPTDNPSTPVVVYCLQLPEGFPTGRELVEEVELTGFFFKRWPYAGPKDVWTTPLLAAKTVRWHRPLAFGRDEPFDVWTLAISVAVALVLSTGLLIYLYARTSRRQPLPDVKIVIEPQPDPTREEAP